MDRIVSDRSSFCFSRYSNLVGIYQIEFFFRLVFAFISFIWLMHRKCWQLLNFFNVKKGFRQFFWGLYKILQWNNCFQCQYEAEYSKLNFFSSIFDIFALATTHSRTVISHEAAKFISNVDFPSKTSITQTI